MIVEDSEKEDEIMFEQKDGILYSEGRPFTGEINTGKKYIEGKPVNGLFQIDKDSRLALNSDNIGTYRLYRNGEPYCGRVKIILNPRLSEKMKTWKNWDQFIYYESGKVSYNKVKSDFLFGRRNYYYLDKYMEANQLWNSEKGQVRCEKYQDIGIKSNEFYIMDKYHYKSHPIFSKGYKTIYDLRSEKENAMVGDSFCQVKTLHKADLDAFQKVWVQLDKFVKSESPTLHLPKEILLRFVKEIEPIRYKRMNHMLCHNFYKMVEFLSELRPDLLQDFIFVYQKSHIMVLAMYNQNKILEVDKKLLGTSMLVRRNFRCNKDLKKEEFENKLVSYENKLAKLVKERESEKNIMVKSLSLQGDTVDASLETWYQLWKKYNHNKVIDEKPGSFLSRIESKYIFNAEEKTMLPTIEQYIPYFRKTEECEELQGEITACKGSISTYFKDPVRCEMFVHETYENPTDEMKRLDMLRMIDEKEWQNSYIERRQKELEQYEPLPHLREFKNYLKDSINEVNGCEYGPVFNEKEYKKDDRIKEELEVHFMTNRSCFSDGVLSRFTLYKTILLYKQWKKENKEYMVLKHHPDHGVSFEYNHYTYYLYDYHIPLEFGFQDMSDMNYNCMHQMFSRETVEIILRQCCKVFDFPPHLAEIRISSLYPNGKFPYGFSPGSEPLYINGGIYSQQFDDLLENVMMPEEIEMLMNSEDKIEESN
jgi:hypothetical protein